MTYNEKTDRVGLVEDYRLSQTQFKNQLGDYGLVIKGEVPPRP